jgi:competence protein ComEA
MQHTISSRFVASLLLGTVLGGLVGAAPASAATASAGFQLTAPVLDGKVNLNTASEPELELLPGIGPAMAKKIVAHRAQQPFKEPLHLLRIKGIGRKTFDRIKGMLAVEGPTTLRVVGDAPAAAKSAGAAQPAGE